MSEAGATKGWFAVGFGLIALGILAYALFAIFGVSLAIGAATAETGVPVLAVIAVPGLIGLGLLILLAKVVVDRLGNAEDDHYSKTVDK